MRTVDENDADAPQWLRDLGRISRDYKSREHLPLAPITDRFNAAVVAGAVSLPVPLRIHCSDGHWLFDAHIREMPSGRRGLIPDRDALDKPVDGVRRWQQRGAGDSVNSTGAFAWSTQRIQLLCPAKVKTERCPFNYETYWPRLTALAMGHVVACLNTGERARDFYLMV